MKLEELITMDDPFLAVIPYFEALVVIVNAVSFHNLTMMRKNIIKKEICPYLKFRNSKKT